MKITRLYTGSDGESHFGDIEVASEYIKGIDRKEEFFKATGIIFRETGQTYDIGWHNAPRRQFVITIEGKWEIEIGDGTKRQFGPGDVFLAEDTTGRGHLVRSVSSGPRKNIAVTLD